MASNAHNKLQQVNNKNDKHNNNLSSVMSYIQALIGTT